MKENPGMKAISKLFLKILWDRFGLKSNKSQFKLVSDLSELYEIFMNEQFFERARMSNILLGS
jgi:hypothetical protein